MATTNPVTGDLIKTKAGDKGSQQNYENGWDRIFGNKNNELAKEDNQDDNVNNLTT